MSTAFGRGLADPKSRGKPVSHANEGRRRFGFRSRARVLGSNPGGFARVVVGSKDMRRARVERESGQNSGARRVDRTFLPLFLLCFFLLLGSQGFGGGGGRGGGGGSKGRSTGGDAKPTFGILSVIPGRDLFSS